MDEIEDRKIRFYLEHQKEIDNWARIGRDAIGQADQFFRSVAKDLVASAERIAGDPEVSPREKIFDDPNYPTVRLYRKSWTRNNGDPKAMVCFQWQSRTSGFSESYFGIGTVRENDCGSFRKFMDECPDKFGDLRDTYGHTKLWPIKQGITPQGRFWEDLPNFRKEAVEKVLEFWKIHHKLIDEYINRSHRRVTGVS